MGKKKRVENSPSDDSAMRDLREIQRCIRRMGLVESRQSLEGWYSQVASQLSEESMREFAEFQKSSKNNYELLYRDFDHA